MRQFLSRRQSPVPVLFAAAFLLLGLTACSSGGLGDIFGGGSEPPPPSTDIAEVRGTVEYVDPDNRFIELERVSTRSNLQNGGSETLRLWVSEDTQVTYDGNVYRPSDLERGDQVVARVEEDDGRWYASQDIRVSYDSTSDQTADQGGGLDDDPWGDDDSQDNEDGEVDADFRGTVVAINTQDRTIELDRDDYFTSRFSTGGQSDLVVVHYDARTRVLYDGNYYEPESIERGDEILVDAERVSNRWVAEEIEVVANVRTSRAGS